MKFSPIILTAGVSFALASPVVAKPIRLSPLHVSGTSIVDVKNHKVVLTGVNIPGIEWSSTGDNNVDSTKVAVDTWHAKIIRVPLSEDRWFGKGPGQTDDGKAYRALVHTVVKEAADAGVYTILDLHWSTPGQWGVDIGQHKMPDQNSLEFWKSLASTYANAPSVIFDLYNEPHDIDWDVWQHGGEITDHRDKNESDHTYVAPGMQSLLDTVRSTGAKNMVIAGGPGWASDLSGLASGHALKDPRGNGVVYANHFYPFGGETVDQWEARLADVAKNYPIFIGEFGSDPPGGHGETGPEWVQHVLRVVHKHNWSWTAWCFHPSASPCLLKDWTYAPTDHFGVYVKSALAGQFPADGK